MDLARLPQIILAIAEKRSLSTVMEAIVGEVARQPDVALARVWLCESSMSCPVCSGKHAGEEVALHLHASAGSPHEADEDWSLPIGKFHQIPLSSDLEIAQVARSGKGLRVGAPEGDALAKWDMEWVRREALQGLCVRPLISKGEVFGVLGVFRRNPADDVCWEWLGVLADTAVVAISNARANEQANSLRRELERERDYLREEVIEVGAFGHSPQIASREACRIRPHDHGCRE